jgi:trans-aconitate methyltransferase
MNLKHPKEFYTNYIADGEIDDLDKQLIDLILKYKPNSVFEFGCGSGKNLKLIKDKTQCETWGQDISLLNCINSKLKGIDCVIIGDERHMPQRKFDVVFTCSVLDHINHEAINQTIKNLIFSAKKAVVIFEAREENPSVFYYNHDYESFGFNKVLSMKSKGDSFIYDLLILNK